MPLRDPNNGQVPGIPGLALAALFGRLMWIVEKSSRGALASVYPGMGQ